MVEQLKDIVSKGVAQNLFKAAEAIEVNTTLGFWSHEINQSPHKRILANLQRTNSLEVVLCMSKLYDWQKQYSLRSIPAALSLLEENARGFKIFNRGELIHILLDFGLGEPNFDGLTDAELTKHMVRNVRDFLPLSTDELATIGQNLKSTRDKLMAHSEVISDDAIGITTYQDVLKYMEPAKKFLKLVGLPYLQTAYWHVDHYSFESAKLTKVSLEKLLKEVKMIWVINGVGSLIYGSRQ